MSLLRLSVKNYWASGVIVLMAGSSSILYAEMVENREPRSVRLSLYADGWAQVVERREVGLRKGENLLIFTGLPDKVDAATISVDAVRGSGAFETLSLNYSNPGKDPGHLLRTRKGRTATLTQGKQRWSGTVESAPEIAGITPLTLRTPEGRLVYVPDVSRLDTLEIEGEPAAARLEPSLLWRVQADIESRQQIRLGYLTDGIDWKAVYEISLTQPMQSPAEMRMALLLRNRSGIGFGRATVRALFARAPQSSSAGNGDLVYSYGYTEPLQQASIDASRWTARIEIPEPISLPDGSELLTPLVRTTLPMEPVYVYDGVRFDRIRKNPRGDWSYGTDYHRNVELHLEFANTERNGIGFDLPPGMLRLYQRREDGSEDLLGQDLMPPVGAGLRGRVRIATAPELSGERERTGYREVIPLRSYEESFEIRLENRSSEDAVIRVVEHLYRSEDAQVIRADLEYSEPEVGIIEFEPLVKAGGKRSLHYTVRYNW